MKNLFTIAMFMLSMLSFAQELPPVSKPSRIPEETHQTVKVKKEKDETKPPVKLGKYVSFSASFSNQEGLSTLESGYGCLEAGISYKNFSGGIGVGKNFQEIGDANSLYIEPRFVWNILDFTAFKAGVIGGFGTYFHNPEDPFVREYGVGTELDSDYVNYLIQFTNWGTGSCNANYFTIGISKSF